MSAGSPSVAERNKVWLAQHHAWLAQAATQEQDRLQGTLRSTPRIDPASDRMAAQRASVDVSTRLFKDAEKLREARRQLEEDAAASAVVGIPAITRYAAALHREGPVSDRLFNLAKEHDEKRKVLVEQAEKDLQAKLQPTPRTIRSRSRSIDAGASGAGGVTTNLAASSSLVGGGVRHSVDDLYRMGAELKSKKEAMLKTLENEAKAAAHPKLNACVTVEGRARDPVPNLTPPPSPPIPLPPTRAATPSPSPPT
jgi:hypothetical protein